MTHAVYGDVILPDVVLRPLHRISYLDLVRKVLATNPTKDLDMFILCELWDALLTKVYDYEFNWRELKKVEVGFIYFSLTKIIQSLANSCCRVEQRTIPHTSRLLMM